MPRFRPTLGDPNQTSGDYSPPAKAELEQVLTDKPVSQATKPQVHQSTSRPVDKSIGVPVPSKQRRIIERKAGPVAKFGVYVPVEVDRRLAKLAFDTGCDRSEIVATALRLYLDQVGA